MLQQPRNGFDALVFEPAKNEELRKGLITAIVEKGRDLDRTPRALLSMVHAESNPCIWEMAALANESKRFRVVDVPAPVTSVLEFGKSVLVVRIEPMRRCSVQLTEAIGHFVLHLSERMKGCQVRQVANQIIADLVVNGRAAKYLPSTEPKVRKPRSRPTAEERRQDRRHDGYGGIIS